MSYHIDNIHALHTEVLVTTNQHLGVAYGAEYVGDDDDPVLALNCQGNQHLIIVDGDSHELKSLATRIMRGATKTMIQQWNSPAGQVRITARDSTPCGQCGRMS